ncbi:MAG TPA: cytidylate kinase-like family protein [Desulfobacterales bacterium]|nr:cytidylate kinase-like family protein [Desulfobacterales bacterium]
MMMNPTTPYVPGTYAKKRPDAGAVASQYVREWEVRRQRLMQHKALPTEIPPCICFSRKVGVGALEVADILARKLHMRVADREILEHMSGETRLEKETVRFYDELYPGKTVELSALLFGKKSFQMDDYLRNLANAVYSMATIGPTIFVGRGTHLILPRERVLAVRLICSDSFRAERLASLLKIDAEEAGKTLTKIDREQKAFFKKAFGRKDAPASEFDLVVNFDHLGDPRLAADLVARCFRKKFLIEAE